MAQQQKKGLIYRLTVGKDNLPDFTPNKLPGSRWAVFKDVFFNRFGAIVKVSLLTLLFMLPAIAWLVIMYLVKQMDGRMLPYSANVWLGMDVTVDAAIMGGYRNIMLNLQTYAALVPLVMIAGLGFAGAYHVMKLLGWGEGVSVMGNYFRGIKRNWGTFLLLYLFLGASLFVFMFNITTYRYQTGIHIALRIIVYALSVLQFVLMLSIVMFASAQAVTYKLRFFPLLKNSLIFTIALFPFNVFFLAIGLLPLIILFIIPFQISVFLWLIFAFLGVGYVVLVWTCYTQWVFDKYVNDKVKGAVKNRGMYVKTPEEEKREEIERIKARNTSYGAAYVSRRLSSIDEGSSFTPLENTFSRDDLARLKEEKDVMREEIEREREEIENTLAEEERALDEAERQGKKHKKKERTVKNRATDDIAILPVTDEEYVEDAPSAPRGKKGKRRR